MARPIKDPAGGRRKQLVAVRMSDLDYGRLAYIRSKLPAKNRQVGASQADAVSFALKIADRYLVSNPPEGGPLDW